jgi:hypothetical protein
VDGTLYAVDVANNAFKTIISYSNSYVECVRFSTDGKLMYVCLHLNYWGQDWLFQISTVTDKSIGCINQSLSGSYKANIFRTEVASGGRDMVGFDHNGYYYFITSSPFSITKRVYVGTGIIDTAASANYQYIYVLRSGGNVLVVSPYVDVPGPILKSLYFSSSTNDIMVNPADPTYCYGYDPVNGIISKVRTDWQVKSISTAPGLGKMVFRPDNLRLYQSAGGSNYVSSVDIYMNQYVKSIVSGIGPGPIEIF